MSGPKFHFFSEDVSFWPGAFLSPDAPDPDPDPPEDWFPVGGVPEVSSFFSLGEDAAPEGEEVDTLAPLLFFSFAFLPVALDLVFPTATDPDDEDSDADVDVEEEDRD